MRISSNRADPGYAEYLKHQPVLVFLDGAKVERCVMADDEMGEIEVHQVDEDGRLVLNSLDVVTEKKHGKVQIVPFGHGPL